MGIGKWAAAISLGTITGGASLIVSAAQAALVKKVVEHTPIGSLAESFVDNVIRDKVTPVVGSVVHCSLYGVEHTGIYIGNGVIVELLGSGLIRETTPEGFMQGTNAISVYVACDGDQPLGASRIALRAVDMIGRQRQYNVLMDNCHQFSAGCISGDFSNANNFFWMLEDEISQKMNNGSPITWRVWDLS